MQHPPFLPVHWQNTHRPTGVTSDSRVIAGPDSACRHLALRQQVIETGTAPEYTSRSHVFVWGIGEGSPHLTKIGGTPYLSTSREWPSNADGNPLPFIGQLSFIDSWHLLHCELPGDVLLFFGDTLYPESWVPVWEQVSRDHEQRSWAELPAAADQLPLFGHLLELEVDANWGKPFLPGGPDFSDDYPYLFQPWATQIALEPFLWGRAPTDDPQLAGGTVIGALSPVSCGRNETGCFVNNPGELLSRGYSRVGIRHIFLPGIGDGATVAVILLPQSGVTKFVRVLPP